ncbi:hypothetical protein U8607_21745 [Methylobacterium durans]|uniref:hypothetical protein n=1 Tax=Methylobacterium durans TaxID=2202825 RepID=UPI002AFDFBE4|nr:hypothetical protein [Methylobacterium durans]MEA1834722.1 hypothetical protein [Methylobacterium durans]
MSDPAASLDRAACLDEQISFALRTAAAVHEENGNVAAAEELRAQARHHSLRATRLRVLSEVRSAEAAEAGPPGGLARGAWA